MAHLIGPDFIGIQVEDLEAARSFYGEVLGLALAPRSPPGAIVFDSKPVPFASLSRTWETKTNSARVSPCGLAATMPMRFMIASSITAR